MKTLEYLNKDFGSDQLPLLISFFRMKDSNNIGIKVKFKGTHEDRNLPMMAGFYGPLGSAASTVILKENIDEYENIENVTGTVKMVIENVMTKYWQMETYLSLKKDGKYLFKDANEYAKFQQENWEVL